jgi:uracil-DNA glycosylase family 4
VRDELTSLVSAFRAHLQWREARGARWVPAASSPRLGAVDGAGDLVGEPPLDPGDPLDSADATQEPAEGLGEVREALGDCQRCRLAGTRKQIVFGEGSSTADLMFIGEAPGGDEDRQGIPFVGAAGQLLTKMIKAMGLERDEVYIANIIKCRPPRNRDPNPDEIEACEPFLQRQIDAIGPRLIVALGGFAAKTLLRTDQGITRLRGRFQTYHGIPLMPTFHPAFLLRNAAQKRPVWQDLQTVMAEMDHLGLQRRR